MKFSRGSSRYDVNRTAKALRDGLIKKPNFEPKEPFDVLKYIREMRIINKAGELVELITNEGQEEVVYTILDQKKAGKPPRIIVCKSRQIGISTIINAYICAMVFEVAYRSASIVAHELESAKYLFGMSKIFHENLPNPKPTKYDTTRQLVFEPPHYSVLRVGTAGNKQLFSSMRLHYALMSEFAKWESPEDPFVAASQTMPQIPDSLMAIEFTAYGAGNMAHDMWLQAVDKKIDFVPIFLSWKDHKEYIHDLAPREKLNLTVEEARYMKDYDLTPEQMKWAQWTRVNQCRNDWADFNQEYPITAEVAFKASGVSYFSQDVLSARRINISATKGRLKIAPRRGNLFVEKVIDEDTGRISWVVRFEESDTGIVEIWQPPIDQKLYVIGTDVAEGVRQDWSVSTCLDSPDLTKGIPEQVAKIRTCDLTAEDFGIETFKLGLLYNEALICVERAAAGISTLAVLEHGAPPRFGEDYEWTEGGYPVLYYEQSLNEAVPRQTKRLGFFTTKSTKPWLLQQLKGGIGDKRLLLNSLETIDELLGYAYDSKTKSYKQTRRDPITGKYNDDEIMSLAMANAMLNYSRETMFCRSVKSSDM